MLDAAADDEPIHDRDDMGDTISWIQDCSSVTDILGDTWGWNQGEHCLHSNVQTLEVESLEHDLSNMLTIFWRIQWWFSQDYNSLFGVTS